MFDNDLKWVAGLVAVVVLGGIILIVVANITRPRSRRVQTTFTRDPTTGAILDAVEQVTYLE